MISRSESGFRSRLSSRVSNNSDRVRCYRCREYDYFSSDALTLTDEDSDRDDLSHSTLQRLTQDSLVDSDMHECIECLNV